MLDTLEVIAKPIPPLTPTYDNFKHDYHNQKTGKRCVQSVMPGKFKNQPETTRTSHMSAKEGSNNRLSPRMDGQIHENKSLLLLSIEADTRKSQNSPSQRSLQKLPINS